MKTKKNLELLLNISYHMYIHKYCMNNKQSSISNLIVTSCTLFSHSHI